MHGRGLLDHLAFRLARQVGEVERSGPVQIHDAHRVLLRKRQRARAKLRVADRQAVLVAVDVGLALQQLGRGIGHGADGGLRHAQVGHDPGQPKVAHPHRVPHDQQVLRLDVAVDDAELAIEVVDAAGGLLDVVQQFVLRDAARPILGLQARIALRQALVERLVAKAHGDDQLDGPVAAAGAFANEHRAADRDRGIAQPEGRRGVRRQVVEDLPLLGLHPAARDVHQVRVADVLDVLQAAELFEPLLVAQADELQGDLHAAGGLGLPDLAERALAQQFDEVVAGHGLVARLVAALRRVHLLAHDP